MKTLAAYSYKRKRRQKKVIKLIKIILFCTLWLGVTGSIFFNNNIARGEDHFPQTIIVEEGDTLWTLAERYLPDKIDIRTYIQQIKKHKQLEGSLAYPGQLLELP